MKRIVYVVLAICTILTLGGCGRSEKRVETRDECYMRLAKKVETYQEVYDLIKEYAENEDEQEAFKKKLALLKGNETVQYALLNSKDLSSELLILILENPSWVTNIDSAPLEDYLEGKIREAKLTPEQEVRIAQNCDYEAAHLGLLFRKNLCCEALCYIANKETTAIRNLDYFEYRDWFYVQAEREWTDEEKIDLMNTGNQYL